MDLYLCAYWPARKESIDKVADRLLAFFGELSACDPVLARWYEPRGASRWPHENPADVASRDYFLNLLDRCRRKAPESGAPLDDRGFHVRLWNGADEDQSLSVAISCGASTNWAANSVIIWFPIELGSLADVDRMCGILSTVARAWEPVWAGVLSDSAKQLRPFKLEKPFVDWMIYLSRNLLRDGTTIHWPGRVEALRGGLGVVISTQDEPPDPTNPDHVANIERARIALGL